MYYNYHKQAKTKIKEGKLVKAEFVEDWKGIKPALVLYFVDHKPMPIREEKFTEYIDFINDIEIENSKRNSW